MERNVGQFQNKSEGLPVEYLRTYVGKNNLCGAKGRDFPVQLRHCHLPRRTCAPSSVFATNFV